MSVFHSNGAYGYFCTGSLNGYITGGNGSWWSTLEFGSDSLWNRQLNYTYDNVGRSSFDQDHGLSARCVRD